METIKETKFAKVVDCGDRYSVVSKVSKNPSLVSEYWKGRDSDTALEAAEEEMNTFSNAAQKALDSML